jgi:hypothetical protein
VCVSGAAGGGRGGGGAARMERNSEVDIRFFAAVLLICLIVRCMFRFYNKALGISTDCSVCFLQCAEFHGSVMNLKCYFNVTVFIQDVRKLSDAHAVTYKY